MKILNIAAAAALAVSSTVAMADTAVFGEVNAFVNDGDTNRQTDVTMLDTYVGIKASEDLGNGTSAFATISMDLNDDTSTVSTRQAYVGLSSTSLGTVKVGRMDTLVKLFNDTYIDAYNGFDVQATTAGTSVTSPNVIAYVAPELISGLTIAVATIASDDNTTEEVADVYQLLANHNYGPAEVGVAYHRDQTSEAYSALFGAKATLGAFGIGGAYEYYDANTGVETVDTYTINGSYTIGSNVLKAGYQIRDEDSTNGTSDLTTLEAVHNFSKRTSVYANYQHSDDDAGANTETNSYGVGLIHKF